MKGEENEVRILKKKGKKKLPQIWPKKGGDLAPLWGENNSLRCGLNGNTGKKSNIFLIQTEP